MRKVSHRDPHLRVSDGLPRLVLIAQSWAGNDDPRKFVTSFLGYNVTDVQMMLDMLLAVQPQLVTRLVMQTRDLAIRDRLPASNGEKERQ